MRKYTLAERQAQYDEAMERKPEAAILARCQCMWWYALPWQIGTQYCDACGFFWGVATELDVLCCAMTTEQYTAYLINHQEDHEQDKTDSSDSKEVLSDQPGGRKRRPRYNPGDDPNQSGLWGSGDDS